ncbi:MAG: hypothetical protein ACFFDT_09565 [Candidatus Hodarchaeota archaeon]
MKIRDENFMKKRLILIFIINLLFILNVGNVNPYTGKITTISAVDFNVIDATLTPTDQGIYTFTATIQNTGDALPTNSLVPITWERIYYELPITNGEGTLDESVIDCDLNDDNDKSDSFDFTWNPSSGRQYDALINNGTHDIQAYALCEGPLSNPWSNRTYYINGKPKIFQLGTENHVLYILDNDNDYAAFGLCDAVLRKYPSPNFQFDLSSSKIVADDFSINGKAVDTKFSFSTLVHEEWRTDEWVEARNYLIPASDIGLNEIITFSCTLTAYEDVTIEISHALGINWSPDGNIRYRWLNGWEVPFESVSQSNFDVIDSSRLESETGIYQFNATVKNTGDPVTQATSPWQYEEIYYELPLTDGKGTLDETDLDLDLNGDTDKTDEFDIEWVPTSSSQYNAFIDGVYVHSLNDAALEPLNGHPCRFYIDNKPKTFTLGTETHLLYFASEDRASFGFGKAHIKDHPSPYFRLLVFANISASNFEVNGAAVDSDYTWTMYTDVEDLGNHTHWIIPIGTDIDTDEEVTFSCTLEAHETTTSDMYLLIQWSPDGNTSYRTAKVWKESFTKHTTTKKRSIGFSFLTALIILFPLLFFKRKRKNP